MLPVFNSPRGSKKATFAAALCSRTLYELRASANDPVLLFTTPLVFAGTALLIPSLFVDEGLTLTRSAHDLGGAFGTDVASLSSVDADGATLGPSTGEVDPVAGFTISSVSEVLADSGIALDGLCLG